MEQSLLGKKLNPGVGPWVGLGKEADHRVGRKPAPFSAHAMQGLDKFMIHMVNNRDFATALLRKITDQCMTLMGNFLHE